MYLLKQRELESMNILERIKKGEITQEVDLEFIHARSPQAKGRVERLFKTLQDRLCKELQLAGITTRDAANAFLKNVYIPEHNAKFAVEPQSKADFHRSIEGFELHSIFCFKFERIINNDYTVCFKDQWFQLERSQPVMVRRGHKVIVHKAFDGTIDLVYRGHRLAFKPITKQRPELKRKEDRRGKRLRDYKPPASHPWKQTDRTVLKSYK
jgi:hypothetical protein